MHCSFGEGKCGLNRCRGRGRNYWLQKLFWIVSFGTSLFAATYMIVKMWAGYTDNPIVTIFNPLDVSIEILPFPSVTICNNNKVRMSKLEKYVSDAMKSNLTNEELSKSYFIMHNINHICRSARTFTERLANGYHPIRLEEELQTQMRRRNLDVNKDDAADPRRIFREASQSCEDMVLYCIWNDEVQECATLFNEIETDYGYCCTFNLMPPTLLLRMRNESWDKESELKLWEEANLSMDNILVPSDRIPQAMMDFDESFKKTKYPFRQAYAGRSSGLSLLLFADLEEYNCTNTDSEGFLVSLNLPLDFPRMRDNSIAIPSGHEVFISIKPELTIFDDSIANLGLDKRKCYFGDEFELKYYTQYTASNCIDECIANLTLLKCACIQYYMPRSSNETVCPPSKYECTENVRKTITKKGLKKKCKLCRPTCNDLEYASETTYLKIKASALDKLKLTQKLDETIKSKDVSIVHMYFGVGSTYPRQRKEIFGTIELLSNAGGLLSLFVGFSVVKLLKFLHDCLLGVVCPKEETLDEMSTSTSPCLSLVPSRNYEKWKGSLGVPLQFSIEQKNSGNSLKFNPPSSRRTGDKDDRELVTRSPHLTFTTVHIS